MGDEQVKVTRNEAASRFEAQVDGQTAVAEFHLGDREMTLTHTVVPEELEGRGIASALIRGALDDARQRGVKVRPQCAFAAAYMKRHPDTHDLMAT
jgi:uncharacterized protein